MSGVKRNLLYSVSLSITQVLVPLISISYLSRILPPEALGKVYFIDSFSYFFTVFAEFGIIAYGIRELVKVKGNSDQLGRLTAELLLIQVLASCLSLVVFCLALTLTWQSMSEPRLAGLALLFFFSNFFYTEWYFWGTSQFGFIALRSISIRLLGLGALFVLVKSPGDYVLYYAIIVGGSVVTILLNLARLRRQVPLSFKNLDWKKHLPRLFTINGITLFGAVFLFLDIPLLRFAHTAHAAGIYGFSIKIVRLPATIVTDLLLVLYPYTVDSLQTQPREEVHYRIERSIQLLFFLSFPLSIGLFLIAEPLAIHFLGPAFHEVSGSLRLLSVIPVLLCFELFFHKQILLSLGQEKRVLRVLGAGAIVFILSTFFLSQRYAAMGAAVAMVLSEAFLFGGYVFLIHSFDRQLMRLDGMSLVKTAVGSVLFFPLVYLIRQLSLPEPWELVMCIVTCLVFYFTFQLLIFRHAVAVSIYHFMLDRLPLKKH